MGEGSCFFPLSGCLIFIVSFFECTPPAFAMVKNLQFVWPKDGPKGKSGHRGFWGRFNNVVTNRGPDIFLQRKGDKNPIKPDEWGNWYAIVQEVLYLHRLISSRDGYTDSNAQLIENTRQWMSRGVQRYDPHTRRYKTWAINDDHFQQGPDGLGPGYYPHFTALEYDRMSRRLDRGHRVVPGKMGRDWNEYGPKVRIHFLRGRVSLLNSVALSSRTRLVLARGSSSC